MLDKAGVPCPEDALPSLLEYVNMLMRWNARMNLVGARTWEEAVEDLIADCLRLKEFLETLPLADDPVSWDPGAGAGLPGIPLRCVWKKGTYHMIEVRSKRALFLSQVLGTIDLARTYVHNEDINKFMRGKKADLVVSRAFLPWEKVLELVGGNLAENGLVVFMSRMVPAKEELSQFALSEREAVNAALASEGAKLIPNVGEAGRYWSSTEYDAASVWHAYMRYGLEYYTVKYLTYRVRAVAKF